jgi:hypothetical protein
MNALIINPALQKQLTLLVAPLCCHVRTNLPNNDEKSNFTRPSSYQRIKKLSLIVRNVVSSAHALGSNQLGHKN